MPPALLIDANLAVLLVVGLANPSYIAHHKRLKGYDTRDFNEVRDIALGSSKLIFTPNVITETSNLARQVHHPIRDDVSRSLANVVAQSSEVYVPSRTAVEHPAFLRIGITDVVLLHCLQDGAKLLTADLDLYLAARRAGYDAENFNHIREQRQYFR